MPPREMSAVGQLVCLLLLCGCALSQSNGGAPSSPCPNVFQYVYDRGGGLQGRISIVPPLSFSKVTLRLLMTVTYFPLVAGVGEITFRGGEREIQEITNKAQRNEQQTIQFIVMFPPGQPVPRVTQVVINGKDFCPNNIKYSDTRGEINLAYDINTSLPVAVVGGDQFYAPGTNPVYTSTASGQNVRPAHRPVQKPYEPKPIPTQFPSDVYHTSSTHFPYIEPESSTTQRPYVPPRTTQRPYVPPRTTQRPYVPPRTTQRPYESQTTKPKTPPQRPSSGNNGQSAPTAGHADCGTSIVPLPLIVGGSETTRGQWPWHVAVYHVDDITLSEQYACGGTLLSPRLVITVAHCVTQEKNMTVLAGRYDLSESVEESEQKRAVAIKTTHPDFVPERLRNDLALLTLDEPVTYSEFVRPACLWDSSQTHVTNVIGKEGTVVGWGFDEKYKLSDLLLSTAMPVVSRTDCIRSNSQFFSQFTSNTTYCAGNKNGTGVCNGDSGGGMLFPSSGKWFLRGLVSTSVAKIRVVGDVERNVCDVDNYSVFTDVAKYLDWIETYLD